MTEAERDQLFQAFHDPGPARTGDAAARDTLSHLLSLAGLVDELSERANRQLAARPPVTAHLDQAREQVTVLCRNLRHAEAVLAFNSVYQR